MSYFRGPGWALIGGECIQALSRMPENRFDAGVMDPPYELGFMGRAWDSSGVAFRPETWAAVLRVLKPGAHLVTFGGSRTFHRMAVALEDAGFELRDTLCWLYGTGFPKSLNVAKAIASGTGREASSDAAASWEGWGTTLKPGWEPIVLARKPLVGTVAENVQRWGTGGVNVEGCRLDGTKSVPASRSGRRYSGFSFGGFDPARATMEGSGRNPNVGRWPPNVVLGEEAALMLDELVGKRRSGAMRAGTYFGRKSAVYQPDAGRPLTEDIKASSGGASRFFYCPKASKAERELGCEHLPAVSGGGATGREDGSAGLDSPRSGAGRGGGRRNIHPTVKPVELMRWLVRLVTPPGGTVLDAFAGSCSTGVAALAEGFDFAGIEAEPQYWPIGQARLERASGGTRQ